MKLTRIFAAAGALTALLFVVGSALASRNSSGSYSLPGGNPVVSGSPITTTWANNTLNDLSTEVTNSLDRNGRGGMLAALRGTDGTAAAPALSFTSEPGTGLFKAGAGNPKMAALGVSVESWTTTGAAITGTLGVTGAATLPSITGPSVFTGAVTLPSVTGPTVFTGVVTLTGITGPTVFTGAVTLPSITGPSTLTGALTTNGGVNGVTTQAAGATVSGNQPSVEAFITAAAQASGNDYLMSSVGTLAQTNTIQLNARAHEIAAPGGWTTWALGLSYDVDTTVGAGGSLWFNNGSINFGSPSVPTAQITSAGLGKFNGGVTIGSTGTGISASYRGTITFNPNAGVPMVAGTCYSTTMTLTGAVAGADCLVIPPGNVVGQTTLCSVTTNACQIAACNEDFVNTHFGMSGTYACRVFNP